MAKTRGMLSEDEILFVDQFVRQFPQGLSQEQTKLVVNAYRKRFPRSTRIDKSVLSIYYNQRRRLNNKLPPRRNKLIKQESPINMIEVNPAKASSIDNILCDLIDEIKALTSENVLMKKEIEQYKKIKELTDVLRLFGKE